MYRGFAHLSVEAEACVGVRTQSQLDCDALRPALFRLVFRPAGLLAPGPVSAKLLLGCQAGVWKVLWAPAGVGWKGSFATPALWSSVTSDDPLSCS